MIDLLESDEGSTAAEDENPVSKLKPETLCGRYRDSIEIQGDIVEPVDESWEAEV